MTAPIPIEFDRGTYNPATNRISLTYVSVEPIPEPPSDVRPDLWYPGPRAEVTFEAVIPKPVEKSQTAVGGVEQTDGSIRWYRVTWNGTAWVNPIRVADSDGNPFVPL